MTRASQLKIGDRVEFAGETCEVFEVSKRSEVIGVKAYGKFISYIYARECKRLGNEQD